MTPPRTIARTPPRPASRAGAPRRLAWARGIAGAAWRLAARRPSHTLFALLLVSGASAFGWNVLMRQTARHPHPLFAKSEPVPEPPRRPEIPVAPQIPVAPPLPVPRPETAGVPTPPRPAQDARPKATAAPADPIGAFLRAGDSPAPPADGKPSPRVVTVQKALAKLGYGPIEADGLMGTTTRAALERFERDKKLPVTGTLGRRTTRQLAQLSGFSIE